MHSIRTIEDLMGVLDDNPVWLEALRSRVLSREVLELPRIVSELARSSTHRFDRIDQRFDQIDQRFERADQRFDQIDQRFDQIDQRFDRADLRMDRLENDIGVLRGAHARNSAVEYADEIAGDLGLEMVRVLRGAEIRALARSKGTKDIPANDLRSFGAADLIIEARDGKDETCYVAVEVSFTANGRDTRRAIRNAGYMARFTGKRTYSVVTGLRKDEVIQKAIASGDVYWYQLSPEALDVD